MARILKTKMDSGTIACPHCTREFKTDKLKHVECVSCNTEFLSIEIKRCKECGDTYCFSCAEDFSGDYCSDCSEAECCSCGDYQYRGEMKKCVKCKKYFCTDCDEFDSVGNCINCSDNKKVRCSECENTAFEADSGQC